VFEAMCVAPDIVFAPCRGNASVPTSFLRHVGETPLSRHRFCAMSGKRLCPDIVFAPCRGNAPVPTSFLRHVGESRRSRHRCCAMSGKRLCPDIVFAPCRGNASVPTSFLHHVGSPVPWWPNDGTRGRNQQPIPKKQKLPGICPAVYKFYSLIKKLWMLLMTSSSTPPVITSLS